MLKHNPPNVVFPCQYFKLKFEPQLHMYCVKITQLLSLLFPQHIGTYISVSYVFFQFLCYPNSPLKCQIVLILFLERIDKSKQIKWRPQFSNFRQVSWEVIKVSNFKNIVINLSYLRSCSVSVFFSTHTKESLQKIWKVLSKIPLSLTYVRSGRCVIRWLSGIVF